MEELVALICTCLGKCRSEMESRFCLVKQIERRMQYPEPIWETQITIPPHSSRKSAYRLSTGNLLARSSLVYVVTPQHLSSINVALVHEHMTTPTTSHPQFMYSPFRESSTTSNFSLHHHIELFLSPYNVFNFYFSQKPFECRRRNDKRS